MSHVVRAMALVREVTNWGASVSSNHENWEQPIPCDVCGIDWAQTLYLIELNNGATMLCGQRCASRLLGVTVDKVGAWRRRKGPLLASSLAPSVEAVVR